MTADPNLDSSWTEHALMQTRMELQAARADAAHYRKKA